MSSQIEISRQVLDAFLARKIEGNPQSIDREQIVAHALLSAWADHWPSRVGPEIRRLLADTQEIKKVEHSRWATQRRIGIAKLASELYFLVNAT